MFVIREKIGKNYRSGEKSTIHSTSNVTTEQVQLKIFLNIDKIIELRIHAANCLHIVDLSPVGITLPLFMMSKLSFIQTIWSGALCAHQAQC